MQVLENKRFKVTVNEMGAELTSFYRKKDEYGIYLAGRSGCMEAPCADPVPNCGAAQG